MASDSFQVTTEHIDRWRSQACALPLPPHLTPTDGNPLQAVPDDALLTVPPHIIAHLQRTVAQGGLQIISPRQIPFSYTMLRRSGTQRLVGDFDVGSIAEPKGEWVTLDDTDFSDLLPDEPIAPIKTHQSYRPKTKTMGLIKGDLELSDPVLTCLIKGRAVVDILRRPDVAGGADEMLELLASAWGVDTEDLDDLQAYSLGMDGPLQRHAMKTDEVYPMMYAPTHIREVISAGTSDLSKELLHPDTAMDWSRCRVHCELVFYMSCVLEGLPIKYMRGISKPGDRSAGANRSGMLTFTPSPATAWSYEGYTFSLWPKVTKGPRPQRGVPRDVRDALQRYVTRVRPVTYLLSEGYNVGTWKSTPVETSQVPGETLSSSYGVVLRSITTGTGRGKTATATLRNIIYNVVESMPLSVRLRVARYISIAREEVRTHLGDEVVPDEVIDDIAFRFSEFGSYLRAKIVEESARRGQSMEAWWDDALAMVPKRYSEMTEGTGAWAKVGMWLLFRGPTDKWDKLRHAIKYQTIRQSERSVIGGVPLPAEIGGMERLLTAAQVAVKAISKAFMGHYQGVADVARAISRAARKRGRTRTSEVLEEASHLWTLRSRALRSANVHAIAKDEYTPSDNHYRVPAHPVDILLKPAPYRPFDAWRAHISESPTIGRPIKNHFGRNHFNTIAEYFYNLDRPIIPYADSICTRYLVDPPRLGRDMERAWQMLVDDVREVAAKMMNEACPTPSQDSPRAKKQKVEYEDLSDLVENAKDEPTDRLSFYSALCAFDPDTVDGIEMQVDALPDYIKEELYAGFYDSGDDLLRQIAMHENSQSTSGSFEREVVK